MAGSPRLNNDDETYISTRFRSENTSKFVIGTLWNTFALVNNLFLQRPRKRRNAIAGDTSIQAEQLAHLERLYSLAEQNRDDETPFNARRPTTERVTNLQAILFEILSAIRDHPCSCYDNQHLASCPFYDHSVPYLRSYSDRTSRLERIVADLHKGPRRDASTQSSEEKPIRLLRPAVQHAATQFRSTRDPIYINVVSSLKPDDLSQTSLDASTQVSPVKDLRIRTNHAATQYSPMVIRPRVITVERLHDASTQFNSDLPVEHSNLLLQDSSTSPMEETPAGGKPHTVRSLVSMFENSPTESHLSPEDDLQVLVPDDPRLLHLGNEEAQSAIIYETIEHYADDVASSILEDAVLTATTTAVHHDDERRRRFSFYNNAGGHGKSLLFQSNTFVPLLSASVDVLQDEKEENADALDDQQQQHFIGRSFAQWLLVVSRALFLLVLVAYRGSSRSLTPRHTLIVGHHIDVGRRKHRASATVENQADSSSLSSFDGEPTDQRHFLSNSQLFSAQSLYIRPWLVRRATAPDIHCLDPDLSDTRVETSSSTLFSLFPANGGEQLDLFTRWTCLISLVFYLHEVRDEHANGLLYEEIDRTEEELRHRLASISTSTEVHSNVFQTINPDGSKRYRTGLVLDVNQGSTRKIEAKQIDWKRVKRVVRRFRKKYLRHRQLIRNDTRIDPSPPGENLDVFLRYFDSTSKRRVKKFARHYAEKV